MKPSILALPLILAAGVSAMDGNQKPNEPPAAKPLFKGIQIPKGWPYPIKEEWKALQNREWTIEEQRQIQAHRDFVLGISRVDPKVPKEIVDYVGMQFTIEFSRNE